MEKLIKKRKKDYKDNKSTFKLDKSKKIDKVIKFIFIIFLIIATLNMYNKVYATNSSLNQTGIYLYSNNNCANFPITFRVLNITEYNKSSKKNINNYSSIGIIKYTIYDGPLSSLNVLTQNKTNSKGYFNFTFNNTNNYLIHLEPENKNFSIKNVIFEIYDCGIKPGEIKTTYYNKTFLLNNFLIKIINANYEVAVAPVSIIDNIAKNENNISLKTNTNISIRNYTLLYNFSISNKLTTLPGKVYVGAPITDNNLTSNLAFVLQNNKLQNIKDTKIFEFLNNKYFAFYYNGTGNYLIFGKKTNKSINISNKNNTKINFTSLKNNTNKVEKNSTKLNTTKNKSNLSKINNNKTNKSTNKIEMKINKKSTINNKQENINLSTLKLQEEYQTKKRILLIVFLSLIILIIVAVLIIQSKKSKLHKNRLGKEILPNNENFNQNKNIDSNLSMVTKVKAYVKKYKKNYTKDQIYLALKKSKVPIDIIEKVFKEEF